MSQSSGIQNDLRCGCRRPALVVTSWKGDNVGGGFYGCSKYPNQGYCKFFQWIDDPLCDRSRMIINGLLNSMNNLKADKRNLEMLSEKLEEMTKLLQDVNGRYEKETRQLKKENQVLKLQLKEKSNKMFSSTLKMCIVTCFCVIMLWLSCNLVGSSSRKKMIGCFGCD